MKKNKCTKLYLAEDVARKLSVVAKGEGMTVSSLLTFLARQKISYYERVKGNIKPADMSNADLSEFENVE
ncbi:MAG: hypothetical protein IKC74_00695 [Clostridia bacterium]|nr:hypothetical protein [Clostridia bacterium]